MAKLPYEITGDVACRLRDYYVQTSKTAELEELITGLLIMARVFTKGTSDFLEKPKSPYHQRQQLIAFRRGMLVGIYQAVEAILTKYEIVPIPDIVGFIDSIMESETD